MEEQAYLFLGFNLEKIDFSKNAPEELIAIRIQVSSYGFDQSNDVFSLSVCVELDYETSKNNIFSYIAGYAINDENIIKVLKKDEDIGEYISAFLTAVIPFIRSNIVAITVDTGMPVVLPTIDCRGISLDTTLVLTITNIKEKSVND